MSADASRIIDANLNRAREALRVLEDTARFSLNDKALAASCKEARDELRRAIGELGVDPVYLSAWRNTPGDVGTSLTSAGETDRTGGVHGVAVAAGKRLSEALRTIEEFGKLLPKSTLGVARIKRLRYAGYELERRITLATAGSRRTQWTLCVLITESLCTHLPWEKVAEEAIAGGADCLQLREKTLDGGELVARAARLVQLARGRASVIINDRADVALASGADGVHVGQSDLGVMDVRRVAGSTLLVGVSTANMEQALAAAVAGADYCGVGPMFATTTKHKPVLSGVEYLRSYRADEQTDKVPHLAIGGITPENINELSSAGCLGVAVSSVVCGANEPREVCRRLVAAIRGSVD